MKRILMFFLTCFSIPILVHSQNIESINVPSLQGLDEVAPFSEGLAAVRKGDQWGFIDKTGNLVIDFRNDVVWNEDVDPGRNDVKGIGYPQFKEGLCVVQKIGEEGIPIYGFMDKQGRVVIEPDYMNVTNFNNGKALAVHCAKTFRGKNNFQLNIYEYAFTEVVLNNVGEIIWPISKREGISMTKRFYQLPEFTAHLMAPGLISVQTKDNGIEIRTMDYPNPGP